VVTLEGGDRLRSEPIMTDLSAFPITKRWPAQHPDRLQLYGLPTPNGVKVSIMLEEIGLPYEAHTIDIGKNETWTPEFLSLNPNGKIPAIIDPDGPGGKPMGLFESGAILVYLAEKTGKLLPIDPAERYETLAWVFFQMAAIGPMFGQVGFFHRFAGREYEDKRPLERYVAESKRLLGVLETRLEGRDWIMGKDYTIADIATLGWVRNLVGFYGAGDLVDYANLKQVPAWLERGLARPAVQRGLEIPARP
jgi:GST-like protein